MSFHPGGIWLSKTQANQIQNTVYNKTINSLINYEDIHFCYQNIRMWGGWNYLLEGRPTVVQASPTTWVFLLGTHLHHCASWYCCKRPHSASVNFFEDFDTFAGFMMGNLPECACKLQSVQEFLTTNGMTPMPHRPHSPNLTPRDFFCFPR